jgi:hypothetical protein
MATRFATPTTSQVDATNQIADLANQASDWADNAVAASTATLTVAQIINASYRVTSGAASSLTTPTAAAIVAALKNAQVGSSFDFELINGGSGTATIVAGSGVTLVGFTAPATTKSQSYKGVVTNATAGAEAVSLIGLSAAGF